ncbi:hypothetical protein AB0I10_29165 [Streptomyces sp. NPDC050636]
MIRVVAKLFEPFPMVRGEDTKLVRPYLIAHELNHGMEVSV